MNEHFAADIAAIASTARVIEWDARHTLKPGKLRFILPSLREFRGRVNVMAERWESTLGAYLELPEYVGETDPKLLARWISEARQKANSDIREQVFEDEPQERIFPW